MGMYDLISSTVDSIKRNKPNVTAAKGLFWDSCDYSRSAVTNIHHAVAVNGKAAIVKLNQHLPDEEKRSQIATNLVKNSAYFAVNEGLKLVPGGSAVANIVSRSLPNDKKSKNDKDLQELKDKVERMEKELVDYKKLLEETKMQKLTVESKSKDYKNQKMQNQSFLDDIIEIFSAWFQKDGEASHWTSGSPGIRPEKLL